MKFTTTKTYELIARYPDGLQASLSALDPPIQHAALRAIAEHLGPEETIAALGTDANAKQFADAQTREAIRAAGYDPDEVGAEEVIRSLTKARDDVTDGLQAARAKQQEYKNVLDQIAGVLQRAPRCDFDGHAPGNVVGMARSLCTELDTARAQLREWRETGRRVRDSVQHYYMSQASCAPTTKEKCFNAVGAELQTIDRLLSATPDEGDGYDSSVSLARAKRIADARAAESELDRIASEQQGLVEPMVPAGERERLRKRVEELEAERDAIREMFERDGAGITECWRLLSEHVRNRNRQSLPRVVGEVVEKVQRAETAVEAMRGVVEGAEGVAHCGPRTPDETWEPLQLRLVQAAILHGPAALAALADYDANKPEPTDERPQARAGGNRIKLKLPCDADPETDSIEFSAWSHEVVVTVQDDDGWQNAVLSRESVRRLVDWQLAWLGGTQ